MITLAQIGCGYWGPNLLRTFSGLKDCWMKWLCDLKPGRLAWAKERYPKLQTTRNYKDILDDREVRAVIVATEVVTHFDIAKAALKKGKHVFVEKPLAHSSTEAATLSELARSKRLVLGVGHVYLYHPAFSAVTKELKRLGKLCYADFVRINPGPPEPKHDVIWDMAPHDVAMAIALAGEAPQAVRALGRSYLRGGLDDAAFIEIRFPHQVVGRIHVSWLSSRRVRRVEAYAETGSIFYDDEEKPSKKVCVVGWGKDSRVGAGARTKRSLFYSQGKTFWPALPTKEPLKIECKNFLDSIRKRRQPTSGPDIGVQVVKVLEAACRSAAQRGKVVSLS